MSYPQTIQTVIYQIEMGIGARLLRWILLALAVAGLGVVYDLRAYQNMFTPEGMDAAQVARNIATGRGYTTEFIRPLSVYLVQNRNAGNASSGLAETNFSLARVDHHPDLANPPVYPLVLAGLMKVLPFHYGIDLKHSFWTDNGRFARYEPDFLIAVFNQLLLVAIAAAVFFLARKLFDERVAWLSAVLTMGCETLWHFTTSGLPTLLLILIFLGLTRCLLAMEELGREPQPGSNRLPAWIVAAGVLCALGALTRYAFGWVIIPVAIFLWLYGGQRRVSNVLTVLGVFAVVLAPWLVRNYLAGGALFGVSGDAAMETTWFSPGFSLQRSLHPNFPGFSLMMYLEKFLRNVRGILSSDLPTLGGSWVSVFFLAGLMLGFRKPPARRLRYFLVMCLGLFIIVQSLGRTQLSEESPVINSENLLIVFAPALFIYGVGFFFTLLDQMELAVVELRPMIIGGFALASCLPLVFVLLPPGTNPVVFPPYYPPELQLVSGFMKPNELMMSDVPWAVAWYGDHECIWLARDPQDAFNDISRNVKPVQALYLTPKTTDEKFVSQMKQADRGWGAFMLEAQDEGRIPDGFPLRYTIPGMFPEQIFLADSKRW